VCRARGARCLPPYQRAGAAQSLDRQFSRPLCDFDPVSSRRRCAGRPDADRGARCGPAIVGHRCRHREDRNAASRVRNAPNRKGRTMDFSLTPEQQQIRDAIAKLCSQFDDAYWLEKDRSGEFPHQLHSGLEKAGWLGIAVPADYGGSGLGITEAAIMMQAIAESGAAMSGASAVHMNIFGLQPIVVLGTEEQKRRMLLPMIAGKDKACFAVTEPDAGLDTTSLKVRAELRGDHYVLSGQKIWISSAQVANKVLILARTTPVAEVKRKTEGLTLFYTDIDRSRVVIRAIDKMGRHAVDSNEMFFDAMSVPDADRIGAEGEGFRAILHGMNPERILIAAEAVGIGRAALRKASSYALSRVVFNRPIGQNQGIAHPLAQCWMSLEAANLMTMKAATLYDRN